VDALLRHGQTRDRHRSSGQRDDAEAEVVLPPPRSPKATDAGGITKAAQRFYQVFATEGEIRESWRWLRDLMIASGREQARRGGALDDIKRRWRGEITSSSRSI